MTTAQTQQGHPENGAEPGRMWRMTTAFAAARLLLRPGRGYQQAVDRFAPYEKIQDPYPEGRFALVRLIQKCVAENRELFAFVNNRFEGSAVGTIEAVINELE